MAKTRRIADEGDDTGSAWCSVRSVGTVSAWLSGLTRSAVSAVSTVSTVGAVSARRTSRSRISLRALDGLEADLAVSVGGHEAQGHCEAGGDEEDAHSRS